MESYQCLQYSLWNTVTNLHHAHAKLGHAHAKLGMPTLHCYLSGCMSPFSIMPFILSLNVCQLLLLLLLQYKLSCEELPNITLWLSVWDWDISGTNKFLGEIILPLSSSEVDLSDSKDMKYPLQVIEPYYTSENFCVLANSVTWLALPPQSSSWLFLLWHYDKCIYRINFKIIVHCVLGEFTSVPACVCPQTSCYTDYCDIIVALIPHLSFPVAHNMAPWGV